MKLFLRNKKILVIYTGGTMGMKYQIVDNIETLAPERGYLTTKINELPEVGREDMPHFNVLEYEPLLDSSCMGPENWIQIANDIESNYLLYDGFVVIMGTDTMAYASSALSFMLENLGKTVVFTGSQIPFCDIYTDARRNLLVSMIIAASSDIPEVCLCFNDKVLRANRAVKVDSHGLDAFISPNFPQLATLGASIQASRELLLTPPRSSFRTHKTLEANVIVLKLVPGFDDEAIEALIKHSNSLKAIVLELYGTGNGPSRKASLINALRAATAKGLVVVAISQCLRGGVSLSKYSMGLEFRQAGVISGGDMTTEACSTKLAYLLGKLKDPVMVRKYVTENIRGEMTTTKMHESTIISGLSKL